MSETVIHYGVKGMRWGQRKTTDSGGSKSFMTKVGKPSGKEPVSTISDTVLKTRVRRLQLEKQYIDLVSKEKARNRSTLDKGARVVGKVLADSGKEVAKTVITNNATAQLKKLGLVQQLSDVERGSYNVKGRARKIFNQLRFDADTVARRVG